MSTFSRRGHWRTNSNGKTFWVIEHKVNRDEWERHSPYLNHVSPFERKEIIVEGKFEKASFDVSKTKLQLKEIWVTTQLSNLKCDYKYLDHLVEYKGVYQKIIEYFSNIYMGIHEEWMQLFKVKFDLPYPETPSRDWFLKFKMEQKELEKNWRK